MCDPYGDGIATHILLGTFARVCLAKLAQPQDCDAEKVFALKILRKVDSKLKTRGCIASRSDSLYSHQVEAD